MSCVKRNVTFLHTIYDIIVKTKVHISCAVIAELIHSFLVGYIAALERLKITPLTYNGKQGGHFFFSCSWSDRFHTGR